MPIDVLPASGRRAPPTSSSSCAHARTREKSRRRSARSVARDIGHRPRRPTRWRRRLHPAPAALPVAERCRGRDGIRGWSPPALRRVLGFLWPESGPETPSELVEKLDRALHLPGWVGAWIAPARARMDMILAIGVCTPVGLQIVAGDPARLDAVRQMALRALVASIPGTRSARPDRVPGRRGAALASISTRRRSSGRIVDPELRARSRSCSHGGQLGEVEHFSTCGSSACGSPPTSTCR